MVVAGWVVVAIGAVVMGTRAAILVARGVDLNDKVRSRLSLMATGIGWCMIGILSGTAMWWVGEAVHAPGFLVRGLGSGIITMPRDVPLVLLLAGLLMVSGLIAGVRGLRR